MSVINLGDRADIVAACITRSRLWRVAKNFILQQNMRLNQGHSNEERENLRKFAEWVLNIGDGKISNFKDELFEFDEDSIEIPHDFCDPKIENSVKNMTDCTYPSFAQNYQSPTYISERGILTPTKVTISHLNSSIIDTIPGDENSYFSVDRAEEFGGTDVDFSFAFPPEYLNSYNIAGLPHHGLKLKVGVDVMLMRNLNQTLGLCVRSRYDYRKGG